MDHLWSPWRYQYVSQTGPAGGCIFCVKPAEDRDDENFILFRGKFNFVLLNIYPYTTGHLMVAPYEHIGCLEPASEPVLNEMMQLARQAEVHLRAVYNAHGL